jgi:microcystin synthetase protein McyJ
VRVLAEKGCALLLSVLKTLELLLVTPKFLLSGNPASYYEYLGDDVVEGERGGFVDPNKPLWLNLGYWESARYYPDAAQALATLLAEAAALGPNDELLDVGFGFAEQDLYWLQRYDVKRITGVNITQMQVEHARKRVTERGLGERIDLKVGSATELPFEAGSFDKVTALECAHHFDTREQFFKEAFRVLRPGGRLALADGLPFPGRKPPNLVNRISLRRWCYPLANYYDRDEYKKKLLSVGFSSVSYRSIRNHVFPACLKYNEMRRQGRTMKEAIVEITPEEVERCAGIEKWDITGVTDYVIFSAVKS